MTSFARFSAPAALLVGTGLLLSACGMRGPLTLPPNTSTPAPAKVAAPTPDPAKPTVDDSSATRPAAQQ